MMRLPYVTGLAKRIVSFINVSVDLATAERSVPITSVLTCSPKPRSCKMGE